MGQTFRRGGIYRRRWQYWYPWSVTRWWLPQLPERGGDEWCNESAILKLWFLGALIVFWRPGRLRTMPCPAEWNEIYDDEMRADYAPCGQYWNGRIREKGHVHWETGVCEQARAWLDHVGEVREGVAASERGETEHLGSSAQHLNDGNRGGRK